MPAGPASRPWRKYLRFSMRGLIVVVLLFGAGLGWIVRQAQIQRDAVAAIVGANGSVVYDWNWSDGELNTEGKPWAPGWLVDLIGVDYFGHVTDVWFFASSKPTDAMFVHVGRLTQLERLHIYRSSLGDAGLTHLKWLTKLSGLFLGSNQVTDAGLVHLKGLPKLSSLDLGGTNITDAGMAHLGDLTKVTALNLSRAHVTDAGLVHLKGLTNLRYLTLTGTQVTDAGMKDLRQALPNLAINY